MSRCFALVPAAGSGSRSGQAIPKQYVELAGRPLIGHTLAALRAVDEIEQTLVVIAPDDELFEKTASNVQEVAARGGRVIMITNAPQKAPTLSGDAAKVLKVIKAPDCDPFIAALVYSVPIQLLAYHTAVHKGTDVDQPRNLAKSVTVE